jgi:hypothetical protein
MKKLLLFFALTILINGCHKDVEEVKPHQFKAEEYVIKKGNHSSSGIHIKSHKYRTGFAFSAKLHANCLYDLNSNDNYNINKLYGLCWGLDPLNNSFRIGWNCQRQNGMIQYFYYIHNHKIRNPAPTDNYDKTFLFELPPEIKVTFNIEFLRGQDLIKIYVSGYPVPFYAPFDFNNVPLTGWWLYFYFGGNNKAPHTMSATIETN